MGPSELPRLQGRDESGGIAKSPRCGGYRCTRQDQRKGAHNTGHSSWRHTAGKDEAVTICRVDSRYNVIPGTESSFAVDTLLVAEGSIL